LFAVRRADLESFARDLEAKGRARATVTRRLCTIAGFYKNAVEEELLDHSPAAHVRRPRVDYESHAVALDRNELGALLVAAGLGSAATHALISLLALNGLRVSEAPPGSSPGLGDSSAWRSRPPGGKLAASRLSAGHVATVDVKLEPGDEGGVVAGQVGDTGGDLGWLADASERGQAEHGMLGGRSPDRVE
jgi:integrase/recombinase XerD